MTITGSGWTVGRLQTAAVTGDTDGLVADVSAVREILHVPYRVRLRACVCRRANSHISTASAVDCRAFCTQTQHTVELLRPEQRGRSNQLLLC
jgi:hypothetical protein